MAETRYIISDAARMINVEPHVLRYWEEELGSSAGPCSYAMPLHY